MNTNKTPWSIKPIPVDSEAQLFIDVLNRMSEAMVRSAFVVARAEKSIKPIEIKRHT